jgi:hypothetical protein
MRKLACTGGVLLAGLLAAVPAAAGATVPTKGTLETCQTGAGPLDRYAVFAGQMGSISGARRLQMRFDLLQRLPGAKGFTAIAAPGLGVWRSTTADIFRYHKKVAGLQAPGAYRAVVRFRWLGAKGVLKETRRTTGICRQPDPGINLAVGAITAKRAGSGRVQYLVTIRNDGRADAGAFDVAFSLGDAALPNETVESLGAGARTVVTFVGARCAPGDQITVHVDPDGHVEQTDRTDDQKVVACPDPTR